MEKMRSQAAPPRCAAITERVSRAAWAVPFVSGRLCSRRHGAPPVATPKTLRRLSHDTPGAASPRHHIHVR